MKKEYFWIIQVMTTLPEKDDKYISYKYNEDFHNPILTTFKKEAKNAWIYSKFRFSNFFK